MCSKEKNVSPLGVSITFDCNNSATWSAVLAVKITQIPMDPIIS